MNIAQQLHANYIDINQMMAKADKIGEVNQDWENETTEYKFNDGSVLVITNTSVSTRISK